MKKGDLRAQRISVKCRICEKEFIVLQSKINNGGGRVCSIECRMKSFIDGGRRVRATPEFRQIARKNIAVLHAAVKADETQHPRWKGDDAGYFSIHDWMTKHFGQPVGCEVCGLDDPNRKYHWANLSGAYHRSRDDFKRMCVSCHRKYDYAAARKNKELAIAS